MPPRKPLDVVTPAAEALGAPTIMDRALAARWGVPYVHAAALAIDVDRIRAQVEDDPAWPFAWEVFLTAGALARSLDPTAQGDLITEACATAMEAGPVLGSQLPFAVWVLLERGRWPAALARIFRGWGRPPRELLTRLAPLFAREDEALRELASTCLAVPLPQPLAPPTRETLSALASADAP